MYIQVRINEEGALRNQRYAFSDRFTLVTELLQNARRAGALHITIDHDPAAQVLRVADDGCGIEDFQHLLTFNESGWNDAMKGDEYPFGVGFSKCLYAARRCIVTSRGQQIDFETETALARMPVQVLDLDASGSTQTGTIVELHGVVLPDLADRIEVLCQGFPVSVTYNGLALTRRYALDRLATVPTSIGALHLAGTSTGKHSAHTLVFLQGFCVMKPTYHQDGQVNVVHLDPRQFMARLPDRDKLIDEDVQHRRIEGELRANWRKALESAKAQLAPERFVGTYYKAMRAWACLDLLNDLDVLPAELCEAIVGYPTQDAGGQNDFVRQTEVTPTRAEVERGAVTLVALDSVSDENAPLWMLARAKGYLVFDWTGLHAEHWAQRHVQVLDEEKVAVDVLGEQHRTELEGRWIWPAVILCDKVSIQVGSHSAEVRDAGVYFDGCLYIPEGEVTGEPVRQASSFTDEHDQFLESDLDADRDALADLIRRLRSVDPVQTLDSLLQELKLDRYPLLQGRRFHLTVGVGSVPGYSVELLEDAGTEQHHAEP